MIIEFDLRQLPIIFINLLEPQRERERERENLRDNNFTPSFCRETEASNSRPGFIQILFGERQRLVEAASSLGRDLLLEHHPLLLLLVVVRVALAIELVPDI